MDFSFNKKREGQLNKPLPLLDLYSGGYIGYQGQRKGELDHRVTVYVKRANDSQIYELYDIPERAIFHMPPVNSASPPEGFWVLLASKEGDTTVAEQLKIIGPKVFQDLAESRKEREMAAAAERIAKADAMKTQEEHSKDLADTIDRISKATSPGGLGFMRSPGSRSLTERG